MTGVKRSLALLGFAVGCATSPPSKPLVAPSPSPPSRSPPPAAVDPAPAAKPPEWEKLAAKLASSDPKERDKTFAELRKLADPRSADWLASFIERERDLHAKTIAAFALAELGDLRALPTLAWRVRTKPADVHEEGVRTVAVRLLADLADIHPERREDLAREAEDAVLAWAAVRPDHHADGMRFLARMRSPRGIAKLRVWADPKDPLPKAGSPSVPEPFKRAKAALRWLGAAAPDDTTRALLKKQLGRRLASFDATTDKLPQGHNGGLNMTLGTLAIGAAYGFAEIGDPNDVPALVTFAEDPKNPEYARDQTCIALGSFASTQQLNDVAAKLTTLDRADAKTATLTSCRLLALERNTSLDVSTTLNPVIAKGGDPELVEWAKNVLVYEGKASISELRMPSRIPDHVWLYRARDLEDGSLARQLRIMRANDDAWTAVKNAMTNADFDAGPGSLPRVVARARLVRDARGDDAKKRDDALLILEAMGERASIEAVTAK